MKPPSQSIKSPYIKWAKVTIAGCLIALVISTHYVLPRLITEVRHPAIQLLKNTSSPNSQQPYHQNPHRTTFAYKSFDGTEIAVVKTTPTAYDAKISVILLHGIRSSKKHFTRFANTLAINGITTYALDLRAHGESGGKHCTFGVNEKRDITILLDTILRTSPNQTIGIFGKSLGGAVALQSMEYDKRLKFGIIESSFTEFSTIVHDYIHYHTGIKSQVFTDYMLRRVESIASFDPDLAKPIRSAAQINQPVLVSHGNEDKRIDIQYGKAIFDKLQNPHSEFIEINNANHGNVWEIGGDVYFQKLVSFINCNSYE